MLAGSAQPALPHTLGGGATAVGTTTVGAATATPAADMEKVVNQLNRKLNADHQAVDGAHLFAERVSRAYNGAQSPLDTVAMQPLPDFLLRQIDNAECKCFMGIFPEIRRVWLTVDHRLFLWNYVDNSDFYSFEGMSEVVITVGLVRPKKDIFDSSIEYLIVLVTNAEIRLLGASVDAAGSLSMYQTDIVVGTDDVVMLSVAGLPNGQIFLGGQDGNLYELEYESEESWFKRKCTLVNHTRSSLALFIPTFLNLSAPDPVISVVVEETRGVMFTLSENSTIKGYTFEVISPEKWIPRAFCERKLYEDTVKVTPRSPGVSMDRDSMRGISIHAVPPAALQESRDLCLVAVTNRGYRVYFSMEYRVEERVPAAHAFHVMHVRWTPSLEDEQDLNALTLPLVQFDCAFYANGVFFAAGAGGTTNNTQFFSALDVGSVMKKRALTEFFHISNNNERVWAIVEVEGEKSTTLSSGTTARVPGLNDLASQVTHYSRQFHILTNHGLYVAVKRRPIDMLVNVLVQSNGRESEQLFAFFQNYTEEQVCAMCLALACENPFAFKQRKWDSAILLPLLTQSSYTVADGAFVADAQLKSWAWQLFFRYGVQSGTYVERRAIDTFDLARPIATSEEFYSVAYNAFLAYFSRLVAGVWQSRLTQFKNTPETGQELIIVADNLVRLREFIIFYLKNIQAIDKNERVMIHSLVQTLEYCTQGLHFLLLLLPSHIGALISKVTDGYRNFATSMTFGSMVTTAGGLELIKELAKIVMNDIIKRNTHIDTICESLKDKCQLFFNADDIKIFKASELIQRAHVNETEPYALVEEALRLLVDAARSIPLRQLQTFCSSFQTLGYAEGAVKLAAVCAQAADPDNVALAQYLQDETTASAWKPEQSGIVAARLECYNCAFAVIDDTISKLQRATTVEALEKAYRQSPVFREVLGSKDEYLHYLFYDHMLETKQLVYLLKLTDVPYLERYLERKQYEKSEFGLYLCLLYRNLGKYDEAVMKLFEFAVSERFPANLEKRIELLSVALSIVESKLARGIDPGLTGELQDMLDVANVQWELKKMIEADGIAAQQYLADLDSKMFNATELYAIADELDLDECKLSIFQVSGHRDANLLTTIWRRIMAAQPTLDDKCGKLLALGQKFSHSEIVFPLALIVLVLETDTYGQEDVPKLWLVNTLRKIGYTFREIFHVYDALFEDKRPPFHHREGQVFLLDRLTELLKSWLTEASQFDRSSFDAKLVDERISRYLAFLSASTDPQTTAIIADLQDVERKMRRIF